MSVFNSLGSNYHFKYVVRAFVPGYGRLETLRRYLRKRYKANDVVLTYKGRQALMLALKRLQLPKGSKVAINGLTCFAVYQAVEASGCQAIFLDIPKTNGLNFSPTTLRRALNKDKKIKAVIVQNTLGYPVEIVEIEQVCTQHRVALIEDLAHSIGLEYNNHIEAGTVGQAAVLSFSQDKAVDAVSGGALIWHREYDSKTPIHRLGLFNRLRDWLYPPLTWLIRRTYRFGLGKLLHKATTSVHMLSRPMDGRADIAQGMTLWHSRLVLEAYNQLDVVIAHRRHIVQVYQRLLPGNIQIPGPVATTYIRFPIVVDKRDKLIEYLAGKGIYISDIWYDAPVSPRRKQIESSYRGECPNAELVSRRIVNLPTHSNVSLRQAKRIAREVNKWLSRQR